MLTSLVNVLYKVFAEIIDNEKNINMSNTSKSYYENNTNMSIKMKAIFIILSFTNINMSIKTQAIFTIPILTDTKLLTITLPLVI